MSPSYTNDPNQLDMSIKGTQALILAPTRELAQQIQKVVVALGDYMNIECHACVGGTNVREDMAKLQEGVQVVVGTPGRVYDMINRRALKSDTIKIFCLDEADEMLSRGFKDQIYEGMYYSSLYLCANFHLFSSTISFPASTPRHPGCAAFRYYACRCT